MANGLQERLDKLAELVLEYYDTLPFGPPKKSFNPRSFSIECSHADFDGEVIRAAEKKKLKQMRACLQTRHVAVFSYIDGWNCFHGAAVGADSEEEANQLEAWLLQEAMPRAEEASRQDELRCLRESIAKLAKDYGEDLVSPDEIADMWREALVVSVQGA